MVTKVVWEEVASFRSFAGKRALEQPKTNGIIDNGIGGTPHVQRMASLQVLQPVCGEDECASSEPSVQC